MEFDGWYHVGRWPPSRRPAQTVQIDATLEEVLEHSLGYLAALVPNFLHDLDHLGDSRHATLRQSAIERVVEREA